MVKGKKRKYPALVALVIYFTVASLGPAMARECCGTPVDGAACQASEVSDVSSPHDHDHPAHHQACRSQVVIIHSHCCWCSSGVFLKRALDLHIVQTYAFSFVAPGEDPLVSHEGINLFRGTPKSCLSARNLPGPAPDQISLRSVILLI